MIKVNITKGRTGRHHVLSDAIHKKRVQHHFLLIPAKKAWPESGHEKTLDGPKRRTCFKMKGLYHLLKMRKTEELFHIKETKET